MTNCHTLSLRTKVAFVTDHITIFRYSTENFQFSGTIGVSGVHLCYYQRASSQLQVGVELEANPRMQESVASIGYQVDLPKSDVVFKGVYHLKVKENRHMH